MRKAISGLMTGKGKQQRAVLYWQSVPYLHSVYHNSYIDYIDDNIKENVTHMTKYSQDLSAGTLCE
jgi:hypothetical protein